MATGSDALEQLFTGTVTSSGNTGLLGAPTSELIGLFIIVTAASGILPSLSVTLQQSPDGVTWFNVPNASGVLTLTGIGAVGNYAIYPPIGQCVLDNIQLSWTVGGVSPSFTFSAYIGTVNS